MAENSEIAWCNHTVNAWWGCTKVQVTAGCANCYASSLSKRYGHNVWGNKNPRREIKSWREDLLKYQAVAEKANTVHIIFAGSMMDIFEKPMPLIDSDKKKLRYTTDKLRNELFNEFILKCPNLLFLLLTKRPSNINKYIPAAWKTNPPANVMFGTSPVNQQTANDIIPQLLKINGRKFLSVEPQLDDVNLKPWLKDIEWVIVGGESGGGKRPFNPDWARSIRKQCKDAQVAFFMKQWDKVKDIPDDLMIRQFPKMHTVKSNPTLFNQAQLSPAPKTLDVPISKKAEEFVNGLSPFKKELGVAILSGLAPHEAAAKFSKERNKPLATYKAYATMVAEGLALIK